MTTIQTAYDGIFHVISPKENAISNDLFEAYHTIFENYGKNKKMKFFIDLFECEMPTIGPIGFCQILSSADHYQVEHIKMAVHTTDPGRRLIAEGAESLSQDYNVNILVRVFEQAADALDWLKNAECS